MREGWRAAKLGEVVRVERASVPADRMPERVTLYSIPGLDRGVAPEVVPRAEIGSNKFRVDNQSVLVSMLNPRIPRTIVASAGSYCSTEFAVVVPRESQVTIPYLALLVSSIEFTRALTQAAKGTTGSRARCKASDLMAITTPLASLADQRRIVDLMSALDDAIAAADTRPARVAYDTLLSAYAARPEATPLSAAVSLKNGNQPVMPDGRYRIIGVLRSGEGFIDRGEIQGRDTGYPRLTQIGTNELVYRKLTAWEGPISVSTEAEAGGWVSPEFPIFTIDELVLRPGLMRHLCRWPGFWRSIGDRLVGSVQRRKRLNPDALMNIELPMPSLDVQDTWLATLDALWQEMSAASTTLTTLRALRSHVLTALLSGEHAIPEYYDELMGVAS